MYKTRKQLTSQPLHIHSESVSVESIPLNVPKTTLVDEDGCTSLMVACKDGNLSAVQEALLHDDINYQDEDGWTALMYAAYFNHADLVSFLLAKEADRSLTTNNGKNVRWLAYTEGHVSVVSILDEHFRAQR